MKINRNDVKIEELKLTYATKSCLWRAGIFTVGDVYRRVSELVNAKQIKGFGPTRNKQLNAALEKIGMMNLEEYALQNKITIFSPLNNSRTIKEKWDERLCESCEYGVNEECPLKKKYKKLLCEKVYKELRR